MTDPFRRRAAGYQSGELQQDLRQQRWRAVLLTLALLAVGGGALVVLRASDDPDVSTAAEESTTSPSGSSRAQTSLAPPSTDPTPADAPVAAEAVTFDEARATVETFLSHLRAGELASAETLWSGYPGYDEDIGPGILHFAADFPWLATAASFETYVTPSGGFSPLPVVTVVANVEPGQPRPAAAFVVGRTPGQGAPQAIQIQRLPMAGPGGKITPAPGTQVVPNQGFDVDSIPVEGSAAAYMNGSAVTARVDHGSETTRFELPPWVTGDVVVTISLATPEVPTADAYWYPITPG